MKYCIVVEHAFSHVEVIGAFDTKDEAEQWGRAHRTTHIWRTAEYRNKDDESTKTSHA